MEEEDFQYKELALQVQEYLLETSSYQMIKETTRVETTAGGGISATCIDHCYTNVPEKMKNVLVMSASNSDHLGILIKKFTEFPVSKPESVKKQNYKEFNIEKFLMDIYKSEINTIVTGGRTTDAAAEALPTPPVTSARDRPGCSPPRMATRTTSPAIAESLHVKISSSLY